MTWYSLASTTFLREVGNHTSVFAGLPAPFSRRPKIPGPSWVLVWGCIARYVGTLKRKAFLLDLDIVGESALCIGHFYSVISFPFSVRFSLTVAAHRANHSFPFPPVTYHSTGGKLHYHVHFIPFIYLLGPVLYFVGHAGRFKFQQIYHSFEYPLFLFNLHEVLVRAHLCLKLRHGVAVLVVLIWCSGAHHAFVT